MKTVAMCASIKFGCSPDRSTHLLRRPYENVEPVGIRPIAKRFSMADVVTVQLAELL